MPCSFSSAWGFPSQSAQRFGGLFALTALLLFANLQRGDLAGYDDAVYAHEGKQMLAWGDWWNVWLNGQLDFDKPPLFIWLEAASFWLFGPTDFAAKFPAALLGLGTVALVYLIARQLTADVWLPALAMFVFATTQYFVKYATHAMTDVPFTFFFTLALWAYLQGTQRWRGYWALCGLAIGAAALIRSHLGWLPLAIVGGHLLLTQPRAARRSGWLWLGLLLALGLPLNWFALQWHWHGQAFVSHHFAYTAENLRALDPQRSWRQVLGWAQYPFLLGKLYWPWFPCLLGGLVIAVRRLRAVGADNPADGLPRAALGLLLWWVAVVVLPFSLIEHKVLRYILPAFPAFALLGALALRQWIPARLLGRAFSAACGLLLAAILLISGTASHRLRAAEMRELAALLKSRTTSAQAILLYANGQARWDYVHQLLWYTDHRVHLQTRLDAAWCHLAAYPGGKLLIDRASFRQSALAAAPRLLVCGTTKHFICVSQPGSPSGVPAPSGGQLALDER